MARLYMHLFNYVNIWIFSLSLKGVYSDIKTSPENIAIESGNNVEMRCASNITGPDTVVFWYSEGSTQSFCYCIDGQQPTPPCSGSATSGCVLTMQNVTIDQAGWYQCSEAIHGGQEKSAYAQLIVLEATPDCHTSPSGRVNVTDSVTMSCIVAYNGSLAPVMTWFNSMGQQLISTNHSTSGSADYMASVTAEIPEVLPHSCNTKFDRAPPPGAGSGTYASNTPSYTSTCYTLPLVVQYAPFRGNITIEGLSDEVYLGSTLQCRAQAEPAVYLYEWSDDIGETVGNNYTLSLDRLGCRFYTCTACNLVGCNQLAIYAYVIHGPDMFNDVQAADQNNTGLTQETLHDYYNVKTSAAQQQNLSISQYEQLNLTNQPFNEYDKLNFNPSNT